MENIIEVKREIVKLSPISEMPEDIKKVVDKCYKYDTDGNYDIIAVSEKVGYEYHDTVYVNEYGKPIIQRAIDFVNKHGYGELGYIHAYGLLIEKIGNGEYMVIKNMYGKTNIKVKI